MLQATYVDCFRMYVVLILNFAYFDSLFQQAIWHQAITRNPSQ